MDSVFLQIGGNEFLIKFILILSIILKKIYFLYIQVIHIIFIIKLDEIFQNPV
jgi:hypothetical protein